MTDSLFDDPSRDIFLHGGVMFSAATLIPHDRSSSPATNITQFCRKDCLWTPFDPHMLQDLHEDENLRCYPTSRLTGLVFLLSSQSTGFKRCEKEEEDPASLPAAARESFAGPCRKNRPWLRVITWISNRLKGVDADFMLAKFCTSLVLKIGYACTSTFCIPKCAEILTSGLCTSGEHWRTSLLGPFIGSKPASPSAE